jgi:PhzF family phenazine biosynthesis protein
VGVAAVEASAPAGGLILRSNREARAFGASARGGDTIAAASGNRASEEPSVEVRMFVSDLAVAEDPITGSFNASLAQWLIADGHAPTRYVAAQGTCIGRVGRVTITQDEAGQVWVGGDSVTCVSGEVKL